MKDGQETSLCWLVLKLSCLSSRPTLCFVPLGLKLCKFHVPLSAGSWGVLPIGSTRSRLAGRRREGLAPSCLLTILPASPQQEPISHEASSEAPSSLQTQQRAGAERLCGEQPSPPVGRQHQRDSQGTTGKVRGLDGPHVHYLVQKRSSWGLDPGPGQFSEPWEVGPSRWGQGPGQPWCKTEKQSTQTSPLPSKHWRFVQTSPRPDPEPEL